jgi:hypothetical protein
LKVEGEEEEERVSDISRFLSLSRVSSFLQKIKTNNQTHMRCASRSPSPSKLASEVSISWIWVMSFPERREEVREKRREEKRREEKRREEVREVRDGSKRMKKKKPYLLLSFSIPSTASPRSRLSAASESQARLLLLLLLLQKEAAAGQKTCAREEKRERTKKNFVFLSLLRSMLYRSID